MPEITTLPSSNGPEAQENGFGPRIADIARRLHSHLSWAEDARTSSQALQLTTEEVLQIARNGGFAQVTEQLNATATSLRQHVQETVGAVQEAVAAIEQFAEAVQSFEAELKSLEEAAGVIRGNVKDVVNISDRIKILALNARIEAARAGKAHAGFDIVARSVNDLADQTQGIVTRVSANVDGISEGLNRTAERFASSRAYLGTAQEAIQALEASSERVASGSEEMARVACDVEQLAYGQGAIQELIEQVQLNTGYVHQAACGLSDNLEESSRMADHLWGQSLPVGQRQQVSSLQQLEERIRQALLNDTPALASDSLHSALESGLAPCDILARISDAARSVFQVTGGALQPTIVYYRNARILEDALDLLEPHIAQARSSEKPQAVVLGNAYKDYHDLGRRIIATALRAEGYRVVDLGLSVKNEDFIEAAARENARVIGVSSLLLHTAKYIPELKQELLARGMSRVKVIVGGAPFLVDPHLREKFGADGVARDPVSAVRLVKSLYAKAA